MNATRPENGERAPTPTVFSPLYRQIRDLLLGSLEQGEWKPGEPIPSEMELAVRFKVSQGTVRKAVDELAAEHLLVRRQGRGTFVATHQEPRAQFRFLRIVPDEGEPTPAVSRFLECRRLRAPADVAHALQLKGGVAAIYLRRLLLFSDRPVVLDDIWLPWSIFRGLTAERLTGYTGPLYGLFESEFGTRMIRAEERIRAVAADVEAARELAVPVASPLLLVERVSYTYGERPVEVRRGRSTTAAHHYRNTLT